MSDYSGVVVRVVGSGLHGSVEYGSACALGQYHIITCRHVIEGMPTADVCPIGSSSAILARVKNMEEGEDGLALLELSSPLPTLNPTTFVRDLKPKNVQELQSTHPFALGFSKDDRIDEPRCCFVSSVSSEHLAVSGNALQIQFLGGVSEGLSGGPILLALGAQLVCIGITRLGGEGATTSLGFGSDRIINLAENFVSLNVCAADEIRPVCAGNGSEGESWDLSDPVGSLVNAVRDDMPPSEFHRRLLYSFSGKSGSIQGMFTLPYDQTYFAEFLVDAVDDTMAPVLTQLRLPLFLSPEIWMHSRFAHSSEGKEYQRLRVLRNALLRRRFQSRWYIHLIQLNLILSRWGALLKRKPIGLIEWLSVLPKLLWDIKEERIRVILLDYRPEIDEPRTWTLFLPCAIEEVCAPNSLDTMRTFVDCSFDRQRINEAVRQSVARRLLGVADLSEDALDEFGVESAYQQSRATILSLLDQIERRWGDAGLNEQMRRCLKSVRKAVDEGHPFAKGFEFDPSPAFQPDVKDVEIIRNLFRAAFANAGLDLDLIPDNDQEAGKRLFGR